MQRLAPARARLALALRSRSALGVPLQAPACRVVLTRRCSSSSTPASTTAAARDEGKSDLYYVAWGAAFLFVFGVPMYLVYLLKEDTEVRLLLGEHAPALVEAVQGFIDIDEARRDDAYFHVDRCSAEETLQFTAADGSVHKVTLPSSASAAEAAEAMGVPSTSVELFSRVTVLQVSEEGLAQLQAALGQLEAAEQELIRTTDPTSPDCTAPQVEQDMLPTRLQHLRNQQAMLAAQIEAGEAQLRALNKKWYHLW